MKHRIIHLLILVTSVLYQISCSNESQIEVSKNDERFHVSPEAARQIAQRVNLSNPHIPIGNNARTSNFNLIDWVEAVGEPENENGYYVFNFANNSGFLILAGDYRSEPIFAYSDNGSFPEPGTEINAGLFMYLEQYLDHISEVRDSLDAVPEQIWLQWSSLGLDAQQAPIEDDPCDCQMDLAFMSSYCQEICGVGDGAEGTITHTSIGPLIATKWGQKGYYNDSCPSMGCGGADPEALTGCVATAMAQVMRFWEHPSWLFDGGYFPLEAPNNVTSIPDLISLCGQMVNMDYGCNGSGADTEDVKDALTLIGYTSNIQYKDYDLYQLEQELEIGRPVILRGCQDRVNILGWHVGTECHAWVCEGLKKTTTTYGTNVTVENRELRMNWGWGGSWNAWMTDPENYFEANSSQNFQYDKKMMIRIHP